VTRVRGRVGGDEDEKEREGGTQKRGTVCLVSVCNNTAQWHTLSTQKERSNRRTQIHDDTLAKEQNEREKERERERERERGRGKEGDRKSEDTDRDEICGFYCSPLFRV
jgi:hypothetical protein